MPEIQSPSIARAWRSKRTAWPSQLYRPSSRCWAEVHILIIQRRSSRWAASGVLVNVTSPSRVLVRGVLTFLVSLMLTAKARVSTAEDIRRHSLTITLIITPLEICFAKALVKRQLLRDHRPPSVNRYIHEKMITKTRSLSPQLQQLIPRCKLPHKVNIRLGNYRLKNGKCHP